MDLKVKVMDSTSRKTKTVAMATVWSHIHAIHFDNFSVIAANLWNILPVEIRVSDAYSIYKTKLKIWLKYTLCPQ